MKQSQEIAIAAQYQERANVATEYWWSVADHPDYLAILGREQREHMQGVAGYEEDWTDEQVGLLYAITRAAIASWDNNYFQYVSGFMTDEAWSAYSRRMRNGCGLDGAARAIILNQPEVFRDSFVEYCLQFVQE